ncbi:hypothetical protein AGIG_G15753 [Arapaima gigas]
MDIRWADNQVPKLFSELQVLPTVTGPYPGPTAYSTTSLTRDFSLQGSHQLLKGVGLHPAVGSNNTGCCSSRPTSHKNTKASLTVLL